MGMCVEKCLYCLNVDRICWKVNDVVWGCVFSVKLDKVQGTHSSHTVSNPCSRGSMGASGVMSLVSSQGLQSGEWIIPIVRWKSLSCVRLFETPWTILLSCFSRVRLCATPETAAHQAPPSLGFSRQEHWSGLPSIQSTEFSRPEYWSG